MAWAEMENYRQLQQEYEQAREQFVAEESAYRKAVEEHGDTAELRKRYEELSSKRNALESQLDTLKQIRNAAAQNRDAVAQTLVI
ncbi:MAG TPA: hypothetical protein VN522_11980 [Solirubrobacterales bacterium]|nr:hypothetical protein [Solirubrobacterales bacterium]